MLSCQVGIESERRKPSKAQQELLYKGLENYAEARRNGQFRTVLEVVAEAVLAKAATQSMLTLTDAPTLVDEV